MKNNKLYTFAAATLIGFTFVSSAFAQINNNAVPNSGTYAYSDSNTDIVANYIKPNFINNDPRTTVTISKVMMPVGMNGTAYFAYWACGPAKIFVGGFETVNLSCKVLSSNAGSQLPVGTLHTFPMTAVFNAKTNPDLVLSIKQPKVSSYSTFSLVRQPS